VRSDHHTGAGDPAARIERQIGLSEMDSVRVGENRDVNDR